MVKEKYLLDANSFMAPYESYYPFDFAPAYWRQLKPLLTQNNVAVMDVVRDEILKGDDSLKDWIQQIDGINILNRQDENILESYRKTLNYLSNSPYYSDKALREWSKESVADPWLIAAGDAYHYTIITQEQSIGPLSKKNPCGRPKIPDIAREMNVRCENLFYFMRQMGIQFL